MNQQKKFRQKTASPVNEELRAVPHRAPALPDKDFGMSRSVAERVWNAGMLPLISKAHVLRDLAAEQSDSAREARRLYGEYQRVYKAEMLPAIHNLMAEKILCDDHVVRDSETEQFYWYDAEHGVYRLVRDERWKEYAMAIVKSTTPDFLDETVLRKMERTLREIHMLSLPRASFKRNSGFLNLKNCLLDIAKRKLLPHKPDHFSADQIAIEYDPKAQAPAWKTALPMWLKDKADIRELQKLFFYILTGENSVHKIFMFFGEGRGGKGTIAHVLETLLGAHLVSHIPLESLRRNSFNLWGLHDKLLNFSSEVSAKVTIDDGTLKTLTGGDTVSSDRKFQERANWKNSARFIVLTNNFLRTHDTSLGYYSRFKYFAFQTIPENKRIPAFFEKHLLPEMSGILNWALEGRDAWNEDGGFLETAMDRSLQGEARQDADHVSLFWSEVFPQCEASIKTHNKGDYIDYALIYLLEYKPWCASAGVPKFSQAEFLKRSKNYLRQQSAFQNFRFATEPRHLDSLDGDGKNTRRVLTLKKI